MTKSISLRVIEKMGRLSVTVRTIHKTWDHIVEPARGNNVLISRQVP